MPTLQEYIADREAKMDDRLRKQILPWTIMHSTRPARWDRHIAAAWRGARRTCESILNSPSHRTLSSNVVMFMPHVIAVLDGHNPDALDSDDIPYIYNAADVLRFVNAMSEHGFDEFNGEDMGVISASRSHSYTLTDEEVASCGHWLILNQPTPEEEAVSVEQVGAVRTTISRLSDWEDAARYFNPVTSSLQGTLR